MKKFLPIVIAFLIPVSACNASITFVNNSSAAFKPEFKFITQNGKIFQCNQNIPLLQQGESATLSDDCFIWGDESAYLHQVIGVQPNEPYQSAFCPELEPPLSNNVNIKITFQGVDPDKPKPANGICEVHHF